VIVSENDTGSLFLDSVTEDLPREDRTLVYGSPAYNLSVKKMILVIHENHNEVLGFAVSVRQEFDCSSFGGCQGIVLAGFHSIQLIKQLLAFFVHNHLLFLESKKGRAHHTLHEPGLLIIFVKKLLSIE
jgi:hypothetical protein